MTSTTESRENEILGRLLHEDKKFSDRANFLLTLQGFLFNAFAIMIGSPNLSGYNLRAPVAWIPAALCVAAIVLNGLWEATNNSQLKNRIKPLKNYLSSRTTIPALENFIEDGDKNNNIPLFDIYRWAPIVLAIAWSSILVVYILQLTIGIF